jgi:hypothetical protein
LFAALVFTEFTSRRLAQRDRRATGSTTTSPSRYAAASAACGSAGGPCGKQRRRSGGAHHARRTHANALPRDRNRRHELRRIVILPVQPIQIPAQPPLKEVRRTTAINLSRSIVQPGRFRWLGIEIFERHLEHLMRMQLADELVVVSQRFKGLSRLFDFRQ